MSLKSEQVLTREQFSRLVLGDFFETCPPVLADLGRDLCRWCWDLDGRCHTQEWEGVANRVAAFSLPIHLRRRPVSKNYAAVYRPLPPTRELWLEIVLPHNKELREEILEGHDFSGSERSRGHLRFQLGPGASLARFQGLILAARKGKLRPVSWS